MKKYIIISCLAAIFLLFCSCSPAPTEYSVEKNGITYEVNRDNKTISDGTNIFSYEFSGNESDYNVNITYPDGSTYWWDMNGYSGSGGWSDNYDPEKYADGDILTEVLLTSAPKAPKNGGNIMIAFLFIIIGIFNIAAPHAAWYLEYGWRYKDAEPSDSAIAINRIGGIIAVIVGIFLIFV